MTVSAKLQQEFFRSAAFLRREFLGSIRLNKDRAADSASIAQRRDRTIFLFDTDLIVTACQPWGETAARYGAVFPSIESGQGYEVEEWQKRTGSIIASYVLEQVRAQNLPIYQLGPHFAETQTIYEKNAKYFAGLTKITIPLTKEVERERFRRAVAFFRYDTQNYSKGSKLLPSVTQMLEALTPLNLPGTKSEQRLQAWERFVKLNTRTGGIYPADRVNNHLHKQGHTEIASILEVFDESNIGLKGEELRLLSLITDNMKDRIDHFLSQKGRETGRSLRDAEAIARLYLANQRLNEANSKSSEGEWRAVFVTGSKAVTEACYDDPSKISNLTQGLSQIPGINQTIAENFSQNYVRHLWAYTTEALLDPGSESRFLGWLDGLLGAEADPTNFSERRLTEIVRRRGVKNVTNKAEITEKDITEWTRAVQAAVINDRFSQLGIDYNSAKQLQDRIVAQFGSSSFETLEQEVEEQFQRTKDRAFVELSETGVLAVVQSSDFGERNPPDLAFGSLKHTDRIFKRLSGLEPYPAEAFHRDLLAVEQDCHRPDFENLSDDGDDRQLNHLKFLVIGAAFASANKWGVALSQGERAVAIIERIKTSGSGPIKVPNDADGRPITHMSGREAYFLCASAQRISAAKLWELERSRQFLGDAEDALSVDIKKGAAKRTTRVRFWSEHLAISLSQYYLSRWIETSDVGNIYADNSYCDHRASAVWKDFRSLLSQISDEAQLGASFDDPLASFRRLGRITIVNIATNIIQCCVIRAFRAGQGRPETIPFAASATDLQQALSLLSSMLDPPENADWEPVRDTTLINAYRNIGALMLGIDEKKPSGKESIIESGKQVAIYDPWRFEQLEKFYVAMKETDPATRRALCFGEQL